MPLACPVNLGSPKCQSLFGVKHSGHLFFNHSVLVTFSSLFFSSFFSLVLPCLLDDSHLLVEVDELHQLLLEDLLPSDNLPDKGMVQEVGHVGTQLKVFDQTPDIIT